MRRRDFLKLVGVAVVAPSLPVSKAPAETLEMAFDYSGSASTSVVQIWGFTEQGVGYIIDQTILDENRLMKYMDEMEALHGLSKATTNRTGTRRAVSIPTRRRRHERPRGQELRAIDTIRSHKKGETE